MMGTVCDRASPPSQNEFEQKPGGHVHCCPQGAGPKVPLAEVLTDS